MFLRKLLGNKEKGNHVEVAGSGPPAGMQAMGPTLQRRFAKGIQYNMKIIIKGDRNVGKSCLFYRLQGQKFKEEYIPTDEIQVASIQWNYKATDDVVKVEVWDVVDKGKKKKKVDGLQLDHNIQGLYEDSCLDAEFVDVYKGTHGVIIMFDITKQWTFDYIERELSQIPSNIPVLVLANHRDMGHHRTVTEDQVRVYIEDFAEQRSEDCAQIRYAESSMRNSFGLKYIHKFFNLPFLQLQRETLLRQLETNRRERELTNEELDVHEESEDQNYELFQDGLTSKRREVAEALAEKSLQDAQHKQAIEKAVAAEEAPAAKANGTVSAPVTPAATPVSTSTGLREAPPARPFPGLQMVTATTTTPTPTSTTPPPAAVPALSSKSAPATPATTPQVEQKAGGFMSRLFKNKNKDKLKSEETEPKAGLERSTSIPAELVRSVEDFVPDEALDASFLDDTKDVKDTRADADGDSSSDEEGENPLVAGFQDDLDSDDEVIVPKETRSASAVPPRKEVELSSEEESEEQKSSPVIAQDDDLDSGEGPRTLLAKASRLKAKGSSNVTSRNKSDRSSSSSSPVLANQISGRRSVPNSSSAYELKAHKNGPADDITTGSVDSRGERTESSRSSSADSDVISKPAPVLVVTRSDSGFQKDSSAKSAKKSFPTHDAKSDGHLEEEEEEEEEEGEACQPVVSNDVEDISDDEVASGDKQHESGGGTREASQENESSGTPETKAPLGLQFEDLSILERGFNFSTGLPKNESNSGSDRAVGSSRHDTDTDADSINASMKKKKHKDKDKEKNSEKSHKKKHKKHRDREKDAEAEGDSKEKKKSKKSKKKEIKENGKVMDDLEAFLGSPGDGAYESI